MVDISKTITIKTDQLNSEDLMGGPRTILIRDIKQKSGDQPISIYFEGDNNKPFKPGLSMRKALLACWGKNGLDYVGRSMTLYNDPTVKWAGVAVGGIRISHLSHMDKKKTIPLTVTRGVKKPFTIEPLRSGVNQSAPKLTIQQAYDKALEQAQRGKDAFTKYWQGEARQYGRDMLKADADLMDKLQAACEAADNDGDDGSIDDEMPF